MMRVVLAITLVAVALLGAEAMPMEEEVTTLLQEEANPAGAAAAAEVKKEAKDVCHSPTPSSQLSRAVRSPT